MYPGDDPNSRRVGPVVNDQTVNPGLVPAPRQSNSRATADLVRSQLDHIYSGGSDESTPHTTPVSATPQPQPQPTPQPAVVPHAAYPVALSSYNDPPNGHGLSTAPSAANTAPANVSQQAASNEPDSTYGRTMSTEIGSRQPSKEDWQQYHSAWQKYYQMYYERTYLSKGPQSQTSQATVQPNDRAETTESLSSEKAMQELRSSIRSKVMSSADKVKRSRHFMPVIAGLAVLLVFVLLQYNRVLVGAVMAYSSPGNIEPQNIIVDPTLKINVGPEPRMIIPKINVDAPVVYGIGPDYTSQMTAMERGIAHFSIPGANAVPGRVGNAVFAAHSSNDVFARGDYKFIFAQNEKLIKGDIIYMNYGGERYTYSITRLEVVMPEEVSKVQIATDKPMLTLVSCVPLGTAEKRLLVFAEQVSPDPASADAPKENTSAPEVAKIPGRPSPTILERLFGAK